MDPEVEPTRELIADALGAADEGWDALMRELADAGVEAPWPWYRDGGWLVKAANRVRTVAWIAIDGNAVTCSFHFAERLREAVAGLPDIAPELARKIRDEPRSGALFRVPFTISTVVDVERLRPVLKARIALR
ncbi:DUF3788 family protein [Kitasatospora sp. CB01950]|uniref:DUF3788 family protein n=1 Tax=Kitasatospora sp. CB01950 TaxID=1703930 RepID=UPI00093C2340|nr:DUF3788 family protein [Kitasatospora sp. CB01950]OKJ13778.1 hypothetical protein AMK19_10200 [Kitasatospora sp. CB01950]